MKNKNNESKENKERNDEITNPQGPDEPSIQNDSPVNESHTEQIEHTGSVLTCRGEKIIHCLTIIGQIEGHYTLSPQNKTTKYEHIIPLLVSIDEDPRISGLLILLNTVGGDVEAGLAIAEVISGMKTPTVSIVLGGGHSIGIPLAVASDKSFIAKSASMMVHPVRTTGLTVGVAQSFEYFQKMQDRINTFVCENSKITKEKYNELVLNTTELATDIGTILEGQEAVDVGLIDAVGSISNATDALYEMINKSEK